MTGSPLPHSLDLISDYLATYQPPGRDGDRPLRQEGDYARRFVVWVTLRGAYGKSWDGGSLHLAKTVTPGGGAELRVSLAVKTWRESRVANTRAIIHWDKPDTLDGPWLWRSESDIVDASGKRIENSRISVSGDFAEGKARFGVARPREFRTSNRLISDWMLFDFVQRLPFDAKPMEFDLLEECELPKPRQRLIAGEPVDISLGGRNVRLHCFEQIGEGILPRTYWLNDQHRLLFVTGGLRNYLHDSRAIGTEAKQ